MLTLQVNADTGREPRAANWIRTSYYIHRNIGNPAPIKVAIAASLRATSSQEWQGEIPKGRLLALTALASSFHFPTSIRDAVGVGPAGDAGWSASRLANSCPGLCRRSDDSGEKRHEDWSRFDRLLQPPCARRESQRGAGRQQGLGSIVALSQARRNSEKLW